MSYRKKIAEASTLKGAKLKQAVLELSVSRGYEICEDTTFR